jgi:NAD(P)H-flavin reductase
MTNPLLKNFNDPFDNESGLPTPNRDINTSRVKNYPGVVSSLIKLTHDTFELTVKYEGVGFIEAQAGQYGILKVEGLEKPRAYSFAKAPCLENPNEITFFIRLVEGGQMSNWIKQPNRVGQKITVGGPMGHFGLDKSDKTIVCIAGGSGMSAINALVEQAASRQVARDCFFFYGARSQADLYQKAEMDAIAARWPDSHSFTFVPVLSEESANSDWQGARGLVTQYFKENYLDTGKISTDNMTAFFCGPPAMIDHGANILKSAGLNENDINYDKFEDARSPAPVINNSKCTVCDECLLVKPVANCIVESSSLSYREDGISSLREVIPGQTSGLYYNSLVINSDECIRCYACIDACPHDAISPDNDLIQKTLRMV